MKRRKEIFLDFTALLDIMMLILFFFVLFSHLDNEKAMHAAEDMRSAAQSAMTAADGKIAEAEKREQKAAERETAANALIARYQQADSQRAADLSALEDFNSGRNLRMTIVCDDADWILRMQAGDTEPVTLEDGTVNGKSLAAVLQGPLGFAPEDTVLCVFLYDGEQAGSLTAYRTVHDALRTLREEFPHLYVSETDISG